MAKKKVINIIKKYLDYLEKDGIKVDKAILFGSYAKNKYQSESDIDVLIISKSFGENRVIEGQELFKRTRFVDARIEPIPVAKKEFENKTNSFYNEIKKYGIEISSREVN